MTRHFFSDRPVDENASLRAVAEGKLPLRAVRRIEESKASGHALFTSTLSPAESVVARKVGLSPLSQVMGSSIFHAALPGVANNASGELPTVQQAFEHARVRALFRMQQEAALLGADIVIDVRFEGGGPSFEQDTAGTLLIEMTAVGTAARIGAPHAPPDAPVLTLLRADEYAKLHHAGFRPLGIAFGGSFWYVRHADCCGPRVAREMTETTRAVESAYACALPRFEKWTAAYKADGVVGVKIFREMKRSPWRDPTFYSSLPHVELAVELMLIGTAVARHTDAATHAPPRPLRVVDLRDRRAAAKDRAQLRDTKDENTAQNAGASGEGGTRERE
jgi:uncharacterized protein YbjQ (UPF0145 family)